MKTWLLTWNEEKFKWDNSLYGFEEIINDIRQIGYSYCKWTCGVTKSIKEGDRIFLIRLGKRPKGIIASGYATTDVFVGTHWDDRRKEKNARRIFVKFDKMLNFKDNPILDVEKLKEISSEFHWYSQSSGIGIPDEIAAKIEEVWQIYN